MEKERNWRDRGRMKEREKKKESTSKHFSTNLLVVNLQPKKY